MNTKYALLILWLIPGLGSAQSEKLHDFTVAKDVVWAVPDGYELTMDIYTPEGNQKNYPVLVIIHGGGWLINNKSIMNDMSQYVVEHGNYVVCNVNYRLLGDQGNSVTMNQIVEDAFGAVLWVQNNIAKYKGDPNRVAVTGDSAGGHLAEMVVVAGDRLSDHRFEEAPYGFRPSYLPKGKTADELAKKGGIRVQAAVISYGAFDLYASALSGFEQPANFFWKMGNAEARGILGPAYNAQDNPDRYQAVSPAYLVPESDQKKLPPQLFTVGTKDNVTTPQSVKAYIDKLKAAGQPVSFWENEGRPHAFMDSGSNEFLGTAFEKDALPALQQILDFLNTNL